MTGSEGVVDRKLETSPSLSAEHRRKKHWKAINGEATITTKKQKQASKTRLYETGLPSEAVTNRLSGAPMSYDGTSRLALVQVV